SLFCFSSRRRHTRSKRDWSSDVCSSDLGPEFIGRMDVIAEEIPGVRTMFFVGRNGPSYTEDCCRLMGFCSSSAPPVALEEEDYRSEERRVGKEGECRWAQ